MVANGSGIPLLAAAKRRRPVGAMIGPVVFGAVGGADELALDTFPDFGFAVLNLAKRASVCAISGSLRVSHTEPLRETGSRE